MDGDPRRWERLAENRRAGNMSRRLHAGRKNPPLATGPKFREDSDLKLIRECAVCCKSHTQRNSASLSSYPGTHRTQLHFATLNDRANQSAVRPRRRGSLAVCSAGRHGAGMAADKNSGGRDQHRDHSGKRQEFHCQEFHCRRPPLRREVDSRSLCEF